jgi:peptide/nickel transport system substrate-binding protein
LTQKNILIRGEEGIVIVKNIISRNNVFYVLPVLFLFCLACLNYCVRGPDSPEKKLAIITVAQSSVAVGDPHICSDSSNRLSIIFNVYEALVKLDNEGNYQPALAESWSVGGDMFTWIFRLREGVTFHNGDTLNADDVVATLERVLDPEIGGAFGTQGVYISYLGTAEISALDAQTVQIKTQQPMADLLDLLVAMPISPKSELHKLPGEYCGSGPYKLAEQSQNTIILEAFDDYWGQTPAFDEIHWRAESSSTKRVEALMNDQADIVSGISLLDAELLNQSGNAGVHELKSGLCIIFMCNAQKGPCRDRRVRQALNYALDKETIIKKIKLGAATPLNGYLTSHHLGYNPETPVFPYDPAKAKSLLVEAGYEAGLELVLDIPSVMPDEAPILAALMAEQYERVGISVKIVEHQDRAAYSEMVRDKNINDACCFDSSPRSTYRVLREKLQSTLEGPWWQGYENKEVNDLIRQAERTFNVEERQKIYRQIYTIVRDDAPWIFLYRPTRYWGVKSTMKDWTPRPDGLLIFD